MDRQARTGDTVLVKSREMTGRSQILLWWQGGGGAKTTENKILWPCWLGLYSILRWNKVLQERPHAPCSVAGFSYTPNFCQLNGPVAIPHFSLVFIFVYVAD
jgi:hypothetical protein